MFDYVLLTQDGCPKCEMVKKMLQGPLREFYPKVDIIHRQSKPLNFEAFADDYKIQATPALIQLRTKKSSTKLDSLHEVKTFLAG